MADVLILEQGDTVYATVVPEVDERELEKMVNPIVQEYFEHGDTKEVQVRHPEWRLTKSPVNKFSGEMTYSALLALRCC